MNALSISYNILVNMNAYLPVLYNNCTLTYLLPWVLEYIKTIIQIIFETVVLSYE